MRHALLAEIASKRRVAIDEAQQQRVEYFGRTLVLQEDRLGGVAGSVWDCYHFMMRHLESEAAGLAGRRVVELGAGTGLAGIGLALCGAHVALTDLPEHLALLRINAQLNHADSVLVAPLAWGDDLTAFRAAGGDAFCDGGTDLVLVSDCIYNLSYAPALLQALRQLRGAAVLFAFSERNRDGEERFMDSVRQYYAVRELPPQPQQPPNMHLQYWTPLPAS